ncbi:ABC transporter ATP-binding protein [Alkalicoccus saliphilus]|jgi:ABC-2 type transport system ATP-binding protein|uniref:ABC transporter ATP-binding protein n=1 Tax=Alkalicoccus saliphilus TaxID=200989 RepID=A0A2T4U5Z1_9BACI|nr:ABC transporter ATP-binding protein [Alkalicoccus saliphilus]PTL38828.1 ABC transporter ATP-binding protein [Alkalicoccus saliphilus]
MTNVSCRNVSKKYGRKEALHSVDLTLPENGIAGIIGPNGSGKSTFLKLISGLIRPDSGTVKINGTETGRKSGSEAAYLSEEDSLYDFMTVGKTIAFSAGVYPGFDRELAHTLVEEMKLNEKDKVKHLSRGNKARLKLAVTMARKTPVLCLDEPLSGMDPLVREDILRLIVTHLDVEHQLCLITSHEVKELEPFLDHVLIMHDGQVVVDRNVEELKETERKSLIEMLREVTG